jgi:hypothetical protein
MLQWSPGIHRDKSVTLNFIMLEVATVVAIRVLPDLHSLWHKPRTVAVMPVTLRTVDVKPRPDDGVEGEGAHPQPLQSTGLSPSGPTLASTPVWTSNQ